MTRLLALVALIGVGYAGGWLVLGDGVSPLDGGGATALADSTAYLYGTSALLAIGLYGATYAIDLGEARRDRRLILLAVTVGVLLKAALIGGALALATRDPLFLILGVVVCQIDPLSVAAVLDDRRMSARARTVLAAWASFDDPLSLVLVVYATAVAITTFGLGEQVPQGVHVGAGLVQVLVELAANLLLAAAAYAIWRLRRDRGGALATCLAYALLAAVAAVAIWQFLMLGLALIGLFLRPPALARILPRLTGWALAASAVLLGVLLLGGIEPARGAALGAAAFAAQIVATLVLTRRLPRGDRVNLALAQQNGITAIILALRLEAQFAGVVAVIAPAIFVTNVIYLISNKVADRVRDRGEPAPVGGR